ncbi:MAG: Amuc_1100 family pilus-like protein [Puniceicoccales bacterium]|jgi:hypothetical protein|nr:Amuc_1100 family pilus-like protein [Puniceicoccales bacterium]
MKFFRRHGFFLGATLLFASAVVSLWQQITAEQSLKVTLQGLIAELQQFKSQLLAQDPPISRRTLMQARSDANAYALLVYGLLEDYYDHSTLGSEQQIPKNTVDFFFAVAAFEQRMREQAGLLGVRYPTEISFGFSSFVKKNTSPPKTALKDLWEQTFVMEKVLGLLFSSQDGGMNLISVKREALSSDSKNKGEGDTFPMSSFHRLSSSKGKVSSVCVQIVFEDYSKTLRNFINHMRKEQLPFVLRGLSIKPAERLAPKDNAKIVVASGYSRITLTLEWLGFNEQAGNILM